MSRVVLALELIAAVAVALAVHGGTQAFVADRLGDPSARRWGRRTLDPRRGYDRFGSVVLPALGILLAVAGTYAAPVFAYSTAVPLDEARLGWRRSVVAILSGPVAMLALAAGGGLVVRAAGVATTVGAAAAILVWIVASMAVIQCMPIPGLDGARALRWALPPRAAATFEELGQYLPISLIVLFFVLGGTFLRIVGGLTSLVCDAFAGPGIC